jgi:hypothetical protein
MLEVTRTRPFGESRPSIDCIAEAAFDFVDETCQVSQQYYVTADPSPQDSTTTEAALAADGGQNSILTSLGRDARQVSEETNSFTTLSRQRPQSIQSPSNHLQRPVPLSDPADVFFFCRYVEVIGTWFDMFDVSSLHFSTVVPQLALENRLLLLSCLATASKQYALTTSHGPEGPLAYYNGALQRLYEQLDKGDAKRHPATFAACLLLAFVEMIESNAGDWYVHLRGTRELVAMAGWNGVSGGLGQAVRQLLSSRECLSS